MLTNLLVTITVALVTNQTETITRYEKSCSTWPQYVPAVNMLHGQSGPLIEQWGPLEKTITLECIKTTTASADYLGKPKVLWTEQESLWRTNIYYRCERIEKWTAWQTNDGKATFGGFVLTNITWTNASGIGIPIHGE